MKRNSVINFSRNWPRLLNTPKARTTNTNVVMIRTNAFFSPLAPTTPRVQHQTHTQAQICAFTEWIAAKPGPK